MEAWNVSGGHGSVWLTPRASADQKRPSLHRDNRSVENPPVFIPLNGAQAGTRYRFQCKRKW